MPFGPGGKPSNVSNRSRKASIRGKNKQVKGKRSPLQLEKDRAITMEMYLKGETLYQIAKVMGVSQMQIHRDLKVIRQGWQERMNSAIDQHKAEELKKLDFLESEAHKAWVRSQDDAEMIETTQRVSDALKGKAPLAKKKGTGAMLRPPTRKQTTTVIKKQGQYGDPRFLAIIRDCISKRCELLGLNIPPKTDEPDMLRTQDEVRAIITQRIAQLNARNPVINITPSNPSTVQ